MRRILKRLLLAGCCLGLLLASAFSALAADAMSLYVESGLTRGDVYHVIFQVTTEEMPAPEDVHVLVDGVEVPVDNVVTYDYADAGTTYFVLVDSSTSVAERALRDIRQIVQGIAAGMSMSDNLYIGQLGETYDDSDILTGADQIAARIDALSMEMPGDDLYQSMADALTFLSTSAQCKQRKCLVVIADGMDANAGGISIYELQSKIEQAHLPVCTIALTYNTANPDRVSAAKNLSGLARQSCGGVGVLLLTDGVTTADAADAVLSLRARTYAAVLNAAAVRDVTAEPTATFTVQWKSERGECAGEYELDVSGIPALETTAEPEPDPTAQPAAEPEATPEPAVQPEATPEPFALFQPATWPAWLLWALIGAAVLIVAAIAAVVLLKKRSCRMASQAAEAASAVAIRYDVPDAPPAAPAVAPAGFDGPEIVFVRTGKQEGIRCSLKMTQPLVIGRNPAYAQLVFDEDMRLCDAQCRLDWKDGKLWISELDPQGSTMLNGVPVGMGFYIQPGDLLLIGSHEYRVFWEKA